jgi:hypothetical protein
VIHDIPPIDGHNRFGDGPGLIKYLLSSSSISYKDELFQSVPLVLLKHHPSIR